MNFIGALQPLWDFLLVLLRYTGFFIVLMPGIWAAFVGLKALAYYLKLKRSGEGSL